MLKTLLLFSLSFAIPTLAGANPCNGALYASGPIWTQTEHSPKAAIHPGFSQTADKIYFYYDIGGLRIFMEQGPYGPFLGNNKVNTFYLDYDPRAFLPFSFFRMVFGNKPLKIHLRAQDGDWSDYYQESGLLGEGQIMQFRIPIEATEPGNLKKSIQLIISRDTGKVFGYGRMKNSRVTSFVKDIWLELRSEANARRHGYGTWYNSHSGMPLPNFYLWELREDSNPQATKPITPAVPGAK